MLCPASAPIVLPGDSGFSKHQNANTALYESRTASCSQKWSFRVRVPFILCRYFLGDAIQHKKQILGQVVPASKQPKHHKSQPHSHDHNDKHIGKKAFGSIKRPRAARSCKANIHIFKANIPPNTPHKIK